MADDDTIPLETEKDQLLFVNNNSKEARNGPISPADKVRYMLFESDDEEDMHLAGDKPLFCQLDILCHFDDGVTGWKEISRWLKYEEKVDDGNRWSKPHVPTTSLHSLNEVRRTLGAGDATVLLDLEAQGDSMSTTAEAIAERLVEDRGLSSEQAQQVQHVLTAPHKHQHRAGKVHGKSNNKQFNTDLNFNYPVGVKPESLKKHKPNKRFGRKLVGGTESASILMGQVDFMSSPLMLVVRLRDAAVLSDLNEVDAPTRFIVLYLGPSGAGISMQEYEEMGRSIGTMITDKVFREVAYKATSTQDLVDGIDEYIDDLTVLPPSIWDPATRLDPPATSIADQKVLKRLISDSRYSQSAGKAEIEVHEDPTLQRTGRLFGGMIMDMKNRYPQMLSDFRDGIHLQCLAAVVFLYFACITPIVTFGGLMGSATDGWMGTMESMLSGAICGLTYHTFAGQPLTIVGATGPLLVFESILYTLCVDYSWHFLSFRFYTGMWISIILMLVVAFDLSALVRYITRFTEESFSVLISLIFIAEAFKKLKGVWKTHPVDIGTVRQDLGYTCHCYEPDPNNYSTPTMAAAHTTMSANNSYVLEQKEMFETFNYTTLLKKDCITVENMLRVSRDCLTEHDCEEHGWQLSGAACYDKHVTHGISDVFLLSCILFMFTFGIAYTLRIFRNSNFFPTFFRNTVADFGVLIAILCCCTIDYLMGINTPKLMVPAEFKTTRDDRTWLVDLGAITEWWLIPLSLIPALLATILIFLDQQISAVIVNRAEHKLKKGHGYHLDLFVLCFLIFVCSLLGLPWFVAATVRSITHVKALLKQSEHTAPGEKPQFLGVREQRVTGIGIHILIGVSVLLTSVLKFVPMPVLYGVFLYMGVTSLSGVQFYDRILIMIMPAKYQPDYVYLRHVPIKRVHIFTAIQIVCMVIMWTLKSIKAVSITFPLMVLALCFIRKGMEWFFSYNDMFWLDHLLPEATRRKREDKDLNELDDKTDIKVALSAV